MKTKLITITLVSLVAVLAMVPFFTAQAYFSGTETSPNSLIVEFEKTPLFDEVNFLPGQGVSRLVKVTNNSGQPQRIATEAINVSDPNRLGDVLNLEIKEGGITRYNDTFSKFFTAGEIYLSDLGSGEQIQYDFIVTFYSGAGNPFQGKSLGFDILIGFQGGEGGFLPGADGGLPPGLTIQDESIRTTGISETGVTITWLTSYMSTSQVIYAAEGEPHTLDLTDNTGTPPKYGYAHTTPEYDVSSRVAVHSVTISDLTPGTTYYYRAVSHAALSSSSIYSGYFSDTETNTGNTFIAGIIDMAINNQNPWNETPVYENMKPGDSVSREIQVINVGSNFFKYIAYIEKVSGDDNFCNVLQLTAKLDGEVKYNGNLIGFVVDPSVEFSTLQDDWLFIIHLPSDSNFVNRVCGFEFVFKSWQTNFSDSSLGFSDTEVSENQLVSWEGEAPIVLNEFVPNPTGDDCILEGLQGEWVEIYNNSNDFVDLADWYIQDAGPTHTIIITFSNTHTGSTIIGPKGSDSEWLVVFLNSCVLNNEGDSVSLYNNSSQLIDSYTYSGPAPESMSYARYPDGIGPWFPSSENQSPVYGVPVEFRFNQDLQKSNEHRDVRYLQILLNTDIETRVAFSGNGSTGEETTKFGDLTEDAVIRFQEKYGSEILTPANLSSGTGYVGVLTRKKLNEMLEPMTANKEQFLLFNRSERVEETFSAVNNNYLAFIPGFAEKGLILAMAINETGGVDFNNEWIRPNKPDDFGRGIMQITTDDYVGGGNGGCIDDNCNACRVQENSDYQCCKYYSNTKSGIEKNIKDGLNALAIKYNAWQCRYTYKPNDLNQKKYEELPSVFDIQFSNGTIFKARKAISDNYNSVVLQIRGNYDEAPVTISCEEGMSEFRSISAVWAYNSRSQFEHETPCTRNDYLRCAAEHIETDRVKNEFSYDVPNGDQWARKLKFVRDNRSIVWYIQSPGEIRMRDSLGNVTGVVDGQSKAGIPLSYYDADKKTIITPFAFDSYVYEVVGTDNGEYGFQMTFTQDGEDNNFTASDIPTNKGAVHQYSIDWDALSRGEEGVTLQIDVDGDGVFEKTVVADNELTYDEFILQTDTIIDFDPDTFNLESKGKFVTAYIELPEGYEVSQIDIPSIILNGLVPALTKPTEIGDYDKDGAPDLMVKFDRSKVQTILSLGDEVNLTLTGKVLHNGDYIDFKGSDMIRVVDPGESKK